jgi:hypothetical protein
MAFRIDYSEATARRIVQLQAAALLGGQGSAFREGLARLFAQLAVAPSSAGELRYHTSRGDPVFGAVSGPAAITFVVHEEIEVVNIVKVERLDPPSSSESGT